MQTNDMKCLAFFSSEKIQKYSKCRLTAAVVNCSLKVKMPRKTASENVVCLCCLLHILANFLNLFLHIGKQYGP